MKELFEIYAEDLDSSEDEKLTDENGQPWKKHRQGRSSKVRAQKKKEKELAAKIFRRAPRERVCVNTACASRVNPLKPCVLFEYKGDVICDECGAVNEERCVDGPRPVDNNFVSWKGPPRYQSFVHFGVRFRQLERRDPSLHPRYILVLKDFLRDFRGKLETDFGPMKYWGAKTFRKLFTLDELREYGGGGGGGKIEWKRTLSRHWLQIRGRLKIEPFEMKIPEDVAYFAKERYKQVYKAFSVLRTDPKSVHYKKKNVFSINYIYLQIMRCESEELAEKVAMFLPQTMNPTQPALNNRRWKEIVDYCEKNFTPYRLVEGETVDRFTWFSWKAGPLTEEYILKNCCFFK